MSCSSSNPPAYCAASSPVLKVYQVFIFSVPVFFTVVLIFLFYLLYLRRRRINWNLRARASHPSRGETIVRTSEIGLRKEVREMLPVVVFKKSFLIRETQCSVCLVDYERDEKVQQIPPCGHTFHVNCIDHWLTANTTCPLCRVSLLPATRHKPATAAAVSEFPSGHPSVMIEQQHSPSHASEGRSLEGGQAIEAEGIHDHPARAVSQECRQGENSAS